MKKLLLILSFSLLTIFVNAQEDTTKPVVIKHYERTDTLRAVVLYGGANKAVFYTEGYVVRKGFSTDKDSKKWNWVSQPEIILILDDKKKPVGNVLQILF